MKLAMILALTINSALAIEITLGAITPGTCSGTFDNGSNCEDFTNLIRTEVNKDLPEVDIQKYADGTANATVMANSGKGTSYGNNFDLFTIKASVGLGADTNAPISDFISGDVDEDDINGVAIGGGLMVGVNMNVLPVKKIGFFDFTKLDVMFNFSSFSLDQDLGESKAEGSIGGFGFMARYRIIDAIDLPSKYLMQWGGVQLHTGFQRSTMDINYAQSFDDNTVTLDSGIPGVTLNGSFTNSRGEFDLESETNVIPVEVSTYMRFLYVFTLYGGAGMDIASGSSEINFDGTGIVTGTTTGGGSGSYTNSMSANESATGSPEATNFRGFLGLQFNIPVVSLYIHLNKNLTKDIIGTNVGLNIAW